MNNIIKSQMMSENKKKTAKSGVKKIYFIKK